MRGFTLIEVLIAGGLLAMMSALGMSTLYSSLQVKNALQAQSQPYSMARQALQRMSREISMAYLSKNMPPESPVVQTSFEGGSDKLSFTAFGNMLYRRNSKQSDQHKLVYFLGTDSHTGVTSLMRTQTRDAKNFARDEGAVTQVLLRDVSKLQFQYWDQQTETWQSEWQAKPSASRWLGDVGSGLNKEGLPQRVRIQLSARLGEQEQKRELLLVTQAGIWLQTPIKMQ
ncbi:MAG: type II secretion system protein GspJ [Myxococcota bacterium]